MDVTLNEHERMLSEQARDFLSREAPLDLARAMEDDERGYPPDLWRKAAGLGWLGLPFPKEYGGEGLSLFDANLVVEQIGYTVAPLPYVAAVLLGGMIILEAGSEEQKARYLPSAAKGDRLLTAAIVEPGKLDIGYRRERPAVTAKRHDGGFALDGVKHFVQYAHTADDIVVFAFDEEAAEPVWLVVDAKAPGVEVTHLRTTAEDHHCHVTFTGAQVPESNALRSGPGAWPVLENALARGAVATCAYLSGAMRKVLEFTTEYAKTRVQFGRPIATFQAVRHRIADMAAEVDGAQYITYEASWTLSQGLPAQMEVSLAKAYVSDAARTVMSGGHQVHGAIGFSEEHPMPLYSRRGKMGEVLFGSANLHRERVAERLGL